jgi:hypothetical protein
MPYLPGEGTASKQVHLVRTIFGYLLELANYSQTDPHIKLDLGEI